MCLRDLDDQGDLLVRRNRDRERMARVGWTNADEETIGVVIGIGPRQRDVAGLTRVRTNATAQNCHPLRAVVCEGEGDLPGRSRGSYDDVLGRVGDAVGHAVQGADRRSREVAGAERGE